MTTQIPETSANTTTSPNKSQAAAWAWRVGLWSLVAWLLAGFATLLKLYWQAPLTELDLGLVSWASEAEGWHQALSGIAVAGMVLGCMIGVTKGTPMPTLYGVLFAAVVHWGGNPTSVAQLGILEGEARLGCLKLASVECLTKFSLDVQVSAKGTTNSEAVVVPEVAGLKDSYFRTTSLGVLVAPLYWNQGPQLAALLKQQRETAAQQRLALQAMPLTAVPK